ncbi:MAG: chromosome segregation protein SMC [Reichenbachiella sp.]
MENIKENQTSQSENPKKRNVVIIYISLLAGLIAIALIYMVIEANSLRDQNEMTQEQLDQAFSDLDSMSSELDTRILKIAQLGGEIDTLIKIKNQLEEEKVAFRKKAYRQINDLQGKVSGYKELLVSQDEEIARLKKANEALLGENTELKSEANALNASIKALNSDREELENKVALASRLKIKGLKIAAISRNNSERVGSFRNRHINELKIEFDIVENKVAPIEGKEILLKITGPDGSVIFDVASGSGTFIFENRESFYTAKKDILYDRNAQSMSYLYNKGTDYEIGTYIVEIFTDAYRMGKSEFTVK